MCEVNASLNGQVSLSIQPGWRERDRSGRKHCHRVEPSSRMGNPSRGAVGSQALSPPRNRSSLGGETAPAAHGRAAPVAVHNLSSAAPPVALPRSNRPSPRAGAERTHVVVRRRRANSSSIVNKLRIIARTNEPVLGLENSSKKREMSCYREARTCGEQYNLPSYYIILSW